MANRDFKVRHGLNVCGNTSLGGNVDISGNLAVGGDVSLESLDLGGDLQVSGSASIAGIATLGQTLTVSGLTSLQGGLVVDTSMDVQTKLNANDISSQGQLQVDSTASLMGGLTVSGTTSLQNGLVVGGGSDFQAKISANQISASGQVIVDQQVQADGSILAGQTLRAGGSLCAQAQAFVNQNLRVTQNTQLQGNLTVSGTTTLCSDLNIGAARLTISYNTAPHIQLKGNGPNTIRFHDTGSTSTTNALDLVYRSTPNTLGFERASDEAKIWETDFDDLKTTFHQPVDVSGTICAGNADIGDTLQVSGSASLGSLRVPGMTSLDGGLVVRGSMSVAPTIHAGNISASGNLQVDGTTSLTGSLTVSGTASLQGGLYVDGESDFSAKINANTISASGGLVVDQNIQGGGNIVASGVVRASGSLCAQAQAFVNQNLRVTQNTDLNGTLSVCGAATLSSTLEVVGNASFDGDVAVTGYICAVQGLHAVAGNIQTSGTLSGTQLHFVSAGGQRMTVSNLDSVSGRVGTLSATKFNFTSAGGQRMTVSSATIGALSVSTINVNQQGNIARRISGTVASTNAGYVTAFTVEGNNLASCIEVFFEGTINSVVVACYAEIIANHSGDITIRTHQGQYTTLDIQVISNNNEDFAVLVKRNGGVAGTANLRFNVYPKGEETVTATATNPYSGTTLTHTGVRGTKTTATGGNPHRFETDGEIVGKQTLTVSGLTSLQGGLVVDTSMDVQTGLQANSISASGGLTLQGGAYLSGAINAKTTLSVGGSTILSGAVQAKNSLSVGGSGTIAGATWANGHLRIGSADAGIAMDPNEIYFAGQGNLGTISGHLTLNPAQSIVTSKIFDSTANIQTTAVISGTTIRCTTLCSAGQIDISQQLHVSGSASLGSLKVAGATCAQGGLGVQGGVALTGELDFNGATDKYIDFALVSSNDSTFTANFRSMNHQSQVHHQHMEFQRSGAVKLFHNNNVKAATRNTGLYVSGTLSVTQDVKVGGQLRAAGAVSVDGGGHIANQLQVGQQISVGGEVQAGQAIKTAAGSQTNAAGVGGLAIYTSNPSWGGISITGPNATKTFGLHYGGDADNRVRFGRYQKAASITQTGNWEANVVYIDLDDGRIDTQGQIVASQGIYAGGQLRAGADVSAAGNLIIKNNASVSGTLSAGKYNFEPYGVVPTYSNSNYGTITYNSAESAIELRSGSDTTIGMAFPAWKPNVNPGDKWEITIQIRASANTTGGVFIRLYEYDAELPDGKIAVSNEATNPLVQEDTRRKATAPQYENQNGSTDWQTLTFEYTPTSTAVWASIVVLNWSGLGTNALYVREPQIQQKNVVGTFSGRLDVAGQACFAQSVCVKSHLSVGGSLKVAQMLSAQGGLVVDTSMDVQTTLNANAISASGGLVVGGQANPNIELQSNTSGTPYIDFSRQVGGQLADYRGRIILDGDNTLSICAQQLHFKGQNICLNGTVRATGDVCMQTVGYANQGFRAGLSAGAVGQYDSILVGSRRGAQGTGDGYASITFSPGAFGGKIDATTSFMNIWTNKNQIADARFDVLWGTSTEQIRLRPRGQDVLIASNASAAGSKAVQIQGRLDVAQQACFGNTVCFKQNVSVGGQTFLANLLRVGGTTCLQGQVDVNGQIHVAGAVCASNFRIGGAGGVSAAGNGSTDYNLIAGTFAQNDFVRLRLSGDNTTAEVSLDVADDGDSGSSGESLIFRKYQGQFATEVRKITMFSQTGHTEFHTGNVLISSGTLRVGGTTCLQGNADINGTLQVAGESEFQSKLSANTISASGQLIVDQQVQADGSITATQKIKAGGSLCAQAQAFVNENFRVTQDSQLKGNASVGGTLKVAGSTCLNGGLGVQGGVALTGELDFNGATNKYLDFMTLSSNQTAFSGHIRTMNHQGQQHQHAITWTRGAQVQLFYNGDRRLATTTAGVYVSGAVSVTGRLDVAGQACFGNTVCFKQNVSVGGSIFCAGDLRANKICAQTQMITNNNVYVRQNLYVSGGAVLSGSVSFRNANGWCHWQGTAQRRSLVAHNNGTHYHWLITGQQTAANISYNQWRPYHISLCNGENIFRTKINCNDISAAQGIRATGMISAQGGIVIDTSFDCQILASMNNISSSGQMQIQGQISAAGSIRTGQNLQATANLSVAGNSQIKGNLSVGGVFQVSGVISNKTAIRTNGLAQTNANGIGGFAVYSSTICWGGMSITGPGATKTFGFHYGGDADNKVRFGRYQKAASITQTGNWEANVVTIDLDNGRIDSQGQIVASGDLYAAQQLRAAGKVSVAGGGYIQGQTQIKSSLSVGQNLHVAGSACVGSGMQVKGGLSVGNSLNVSGNFKAQRVCAQTQCVVNAQLITRQNLYVSGASVLSGTVSFKNTNGFTHWNGTQQRRSGMWRNDGGNYWFLVTGQQNAANVSYNTWRPFRVQLSNGETHFRTKINCDTISSNGQLIAKNQAIISGVVKTQQYLLVSSSREKDYQIIACGTCATSGNLTYKRLKRRGRANDHFATWYSNSAADAEFRFRTDGRVCADGQFFTGGADFAEYFEWADGNTNVSDRIGRSVVITGASGKIGIATSGQTPFGVVTGIGGYVGDAAALKWKGRYLTDDYGRVMRTDDGTRIENPEYNSACTYIARADRPEWDTIGLVGKVPVRVGEVLNPNWMKLRVITPTIEEYLIR